MTALTIEEVRGILEIALDQELDSLSCQDHLYEKLGLDSMGAVAMVVEVQRRTGLRISDERIPQIMTVGELIEEISVCADKQETA